MVHDPSFGDIGGGGGGHVDICIPADGRFWGSISLPWIPENTKASTYIISNMRISSIIFLMKNRSNHGVLHTRSRYAPILVSTPPLFAAQYQKHVNNEEGISQRGTPLFADLI